MPIIPVTLLYAAVALAAPQDGQPPAPQQSEFPSSLRVNIKMKDTGAGVPNLRLRVFRLDDPSRAYDPRAGVTNERGWFRFVRLDPGLYRVELDPMNHRSFEPGQRLDSYIDYNLPQELGDIRVEADKEALLIFEAPLGVTVRGRAVDSSGVPLADAVVNSPQVCVGTGKVSTDGEGRFELRGAVRGRELRGSIHVRGSRCHLFFTVPAERMNAAAVVAMPAVIMPAAAPQDNLRLTVSDANGVPIRRANLWLHGIDVPMECLVVTRNGSGSTAVPPGRYTLANRRITGDSVLNFEPYESQVTLSAASVVEHAVQLKYRPGHEPQSRPPASAGATPPATKPPQDADGASSEPPKAPAPKPGQ